MRMICIASALCVLGATNYAVSIAGGPPEPVKADPLEATHQAILKDFARDRAGFPPDHPLVKWGMKILMREHALERAIRDFFSSTPERRINLATRRASQALGNRRYVVERVEKLTILEYPRSRDPRALSRPFPFLKHPRAKVTVFEPSADKLLDLDFTSYAFITRKQLGWGRRLRSPGPYERYVLSFEFTGDKARVVSCQKDETFDSRDFVIWATEHRIRLRLEDFFLHRSPQERRRRLPEGADVPFPGKHLAAWSGGDRILKVADGGEPPAGPWDADVFLVEKGTSPPVGERFVLLVRYDLETDTIEILSCKHDQEHHRIGEFVWNYLRGDEEYRQGARAEGLEPQLPPTGKVQPYIAPGHYSRISPTRRGTWECFFYVLRSEIPGRVRGEVAEFECEVAAGRDGKLKIIKERYKYLEPYRGRH